MASWSTRVHKIPGPRMVIFCTTTPNILTTITAIFNDKIFSNTPWRYSGIARVHLHTFLISIVAPGGWPTACCDCFIPRKRTPDIHLVGSLRWRGGAGVVTAGLDLWTAVKFLVAAGNQTPDYPVRSAVVPLSARRQTSNNSCDLHYGVGHFDSKQGQQLSWPRNLCFVNPESL